MNLALVNISLISSVVKFSEQKEEDQHHDGLRYAECGP